MRWSSPESRSVVLASMALGLSLLGATPPDRGQDPAPPPAPSAEMSKTLENLDRSIAQKLDAGRVAEAVPPARDKLELLERGLGPDHWQVVDARRDLETYQRLCGLPLGDQDRLAGARRKVDEARQLQNRGRYEEVVRLIEDALPIYREILGEDHSEVASLHDNRARALYDLVRYAESEAALRIGLAIRLRVLGEDHPETASNYVNVAFTLKDQGKLTEAEALERRALAIHLKILGEFHRETAISYGNLGETLRGLSKYVEAEAMSRRGLAINRKLLGEDHPSTATSHDNLGLALLNQGRYAEALSEQRLALAIYIKALGEDDLETATCYSNLAETLRNQGMYAEAEAMHRRALANKLKALGEDHPTTVVSINNLASTLHGQGKDVEAEAMQRLALAIELKLLGEDHPQTAICYSNLAFTLSDQRKYLEAEAMQRLALVVEIKALGEDHRQTAASYNNLSGILRLQGKHAEAEASQRRALAIDIKVLGENHPDTAIAYDNLARNLQDQGRLTEAEALHRHALGIMLKVLGEDHPEVARSTKGLAECLGLQGKYEEALGTWTLAASSHERARRRGAKGLDASLTTLESPLPGFALALARAGRPREAWTRWEQGLARGLVDEVLGRAARPLTAEEREAEARLLGQSQVIDERIGKLLSLKSPTQEQEKLLDDLRRQGSDLRRQILDLGQQFETRYGTLAGRPASLAVAQKALREDTVLVGWIDQNPYHWACLLRHSGDPVWVQIPGSGKDGAWIEEEDATAQRLRNELDPQTTRGLSRPLAEVMARQRLEPLKEHLRGIKRLVVVNSPGLAGVPVEVLMAARPDPAWDGIDASYAPSASMFGHLAGQPSPRDRRPTLLALADPAYPEIKQDTPAPVPPDRGIAVARVLPNGNADLNGIRPGDVLLAYSGMALEKPGDLKLVRADAGPKKVPVSYWREGVTRAVEVAAGPLGIAVDPRPVKKAVQARQASERVLMGMRGGSRERLPGTRREVEAIARLFPAEGSSILMDAQACESTVRRLADSGRLKDYRYLHFAAHGESDPRNAYRSALILAPDPELPADPLSTESDGTITADQIARTWDLDADLVVLSACESGLGRAAGGEGYLGFSQPLFARGARSLVLSQWKVDDDATALLMTRFYENLLGKRRGLESPLPKAEALSEAKRWLRAAVAEEVGTALASLPRGKIVRREAMANVPAPRPYENPTYWSGFLLIGSPD